MKPPPVLYAEDDVNDAFFLRHAWKRAGVPNELVVVENGNKVLAYLNGEGLFADREKTPLPCLLILDLRLPGKDGLQVLRWIREHPVHKSLRVVILSASGLQSDIKATQALGITDYIVKPTSPDQLIDVINSHKEGWVGIPAQSRRAAKTG